jgi:hypothetical protein
VDLLNFYPSGSSLEFRLQTIREAAPDVAERLLVNLSRFSGKPLAEKWPTVGIEAFADDFERFTQEVLAPYVEARSRYSRKRRATAPG